MRAEAETATIDVERIRADFPVLSREIRSGVRLIYLDSAATAQKPRQVIEAVSSFYANQNANIHRGIHALAEEATSSYEAARQRVADFVGAPSSSQLVFTRNATEAINLVARSWGRANLRSGDCILLTEMEHHSNLVPWYILAEELGLRLEFIPLTEDGRLELEVYGQLLEERPKLVAFAHMSNMLGTINPVSRMTDMAHQAGAVVVVDAAQSVPHFPVDVAELNVDFLAFSGHKMCGPTGIGVLYGKKELLEAMPPFLGGGDMIKRVGLREFVPNDLPYKFEAGTPAIAQAIGLASAVEFLEGIGMEAIHRHGRSLIGYALERLAEVPGVRVYGPGANHRGGVASFKLEGAHPHDVAQILDGYGIAVRAGHHCAMPLHQKLGLPASTRASFYLYNTQDEIDSLIEGLYHVKEIFE